MDNETGAEEVIMSLQMQLVVAEGRIKELQRCCVIGGDGKPFAVGYMVWYWAKEWKCPFEILVESIRQTGDETEVNDYIGGLHARDCYSSASAVPDVKGGE